MVDSSSAPRALMVAGGGYPGGAQTALAASAGPIQVPHDAAAQFNQCNFCNEYKLTAKPHPPSSSRADRFGKRVLFDGSLLDHVPQALAVEF